MSLPFGDKPCMHEVLFDDAWLKDTGVTTLDFAKAMIDEGYHPMTMYFPLVVHGAMLIEPTESESKASLDLFIATLRDLAMAAKRGETERFTGAPTSPAPPPRRDARRAQSGAEMDAAEAAGGSGGVGRWQRIAHCEIRSVARRQIGRCVARCLASSPPFRGRQA